MTSYVDELNKDLTVLEGKRGPSSKYTLPSEHLTGKLEFKFDEHYFEGIACSLDSVGFKCVRVVDYVIEGRWVMVLFFYGWIHTDGLL